MGEVGGELAQLGERLLCTQEVTGSSPVFSTKLEKEAEPFPSERLSLWLEFAHHSLWRRWDKSTEESSLKTEYLVNLAAIVVGSLELGNEGGRIWVTTFAQMR